MDERKKTIEVQATTPDQDKKLDRLREGLRVWLEGAAAEGIEHELALTALMLFCASGCASNGIPKDELLGVFGAYYDMYKKNLGTLRAIQ